MLVGDLLVLGASDIFCDGREAVGVALICFMVLLSSSFPSCPVAVRFVHFFPFLFV